MSLISRIVDTLLPPYDEVGAPPGPPPVLVDGTPPSPPPERTRMATPSDVAMVLDHRAARRGRGRAWRSSLDELLDLLEADGLRPERAQLAAELNVENDEAALHCALIQRLADNGAIAPESFYK